jgi:hypothetical protein
MDTLLPAPVTIATPIDWRVPLILVWLNGAGIVWLIAIVRVRRTHRVLCERKLADM